MQKQKKKKIFFFPKKRNDIKAIKCRNTSLSLIECGWDKRYAKTMCDDYTKNLEKELNCKDKCEVFYKKLNKANIKYAKD